MVEALPSDPVILQALVRTLQAQVAEQAQVTARLRAALDAHLRHRFGRRAEQLHPAQLELFLTELS